MKSLLKKIIITLTIFTLCIGLSACKTDKCNNGHSWKLTSTTATCLADGIETFACEACGETKTVNVSAYGHEMVQSSYTAPTCKTNGEKVEKCSRCGFENKQTLLTVDHDYQLKSATQSTCTTKGNKAFECSMCHEPKVEELPLLNHDYRLVNTTASTCIIKGAKYFECEECEDGYSEPLPLAEHDYGLVNKIEPTCVLVGSEGYECTVCHDTYSEELPIVDHKYEPTNISATCFTHGGTVDKCTFCQDEKSITETPILEHDFGVDGYCTHCGIYKTLFDIDKLNTSWIKITDFGQIEGDLVAKFKDDNGTIPDSYWQNHTVTLTVAMFDIDGELLEAHSFNSTTIPFEGANYGKLTIQYVRATGEIGDFRVNQFLIFPDEGNIFSLENRQNCKSFKIEISCDGYKTIEKTYTI